MFYRVTQIQLFHIRYLSFVHNLQLFIQFSLSNKTTVASNALIFRSDAESLWCWIYVTFISNRSCSQTTILHYLHTKLHFHSRPWLHLCYRYKHSFICSILNNQGDLIHLCFTSRWPWNYSLSIPFIHMHALFLSYIIIVILAIKLQFHIHLNILYFKPIHLVICFFLKEEKCNKLSYIHTILESLLKNKKLACTVLPDFAHLFLVHTL